MGKHWGARAERSWRALAMVVVLSAALVGGARGEDTRKRTFSNADLPAPQTTGAAPAVEPSPVPQPSQPAQEDDWTIAGWERRLRHLRTERLDAERAVAGLERDLSRLGFELLDVPAERADKAREDLARVRTELAAARESLAAVRAREPGLVEKARICGLPEARAAELLAP